MIDVATLEKLIERVSHTYTDSERYLNTIGKELLESCSFDSQSKRRLDVLKKELEKLAPDFVLAVANQGLIYGAMASHLGYRTIIIEAHRKIGEYDRKSHNYWKGRDKKIIWYYLIPEKIVDGGKYYNFLNPETIIRDPVETPYKVGIIEIDKIEPNKNIVVVDDIVEWGLTISAVNKFILDNGSKNLKNIVTHTYVYSDGTPVCPNVLVLPSLL